MKMAEIKEYTEKKLTKFVMVTRKFISSEKKFLRKMLNNSRPAISHMPSFNTTIAASEQRNKDAIKILKGQLKMQYEDLADKTKEKQRTLLATVEVLVNETKQDITAQTAAEIKAVHDQCTNVLSISKSNQIEIAELNDTTSAVQRQQQALTDQLTLAFKNITSQNKRPVSGNFLLVTDSIRKGIYRMDMASQSYVSIGITVTQTDNPIGIDYDQVEGRIYWSDTGLEQIRSINIDGTGERVDRQLNINAVPDGIAVDPISRLIYYTDTGNDVITVLKMDTVFEKVIINTGLNEPRAIVLDPTNGKIYWTDWGSSPKVETANYDGSNRNSIINTGLGFVNGLALDSAGGKIYWADAKTTMIEGANIDGSGRHTILQDGGHRYFGLALSGTTLYYTVWNQVSLFSSQVMSVPVTGGISTRVGPSAVGRLNDIHVHREGVQPQGNACSDDMGGCSHFCLPMDSNNFKCACATGYNLQSDDKTCI